MSTTLSAQRFSVPDPLSAIEFCYEQGWTDGLPVVPPTEERVQEFIAFTQRAPDEVVVTEQTRRRRITVEKVAINAVMAGCLPAYMPVILAALEAMGEEPYNLHGSVTSTGGAAPLLIINGPIRKELHLNSGVNVFGPGWRANATIGRAIRLILMNGLGAIPGILDKSTQGHPGKYSFCIAENEEENPWEPLQVERGFSPETSTVTVFAGESPHNIQNHYSHTPEGILTTLADTMAALGSFSDGESVVVLAPEHVQIIARAGWTKQDIREYLFRHARRSLAELKRCGKFPGVVEPGDEEKMIPRGLKAEDILIVVAGGGPGGHSAFIPSWSRRRNSLCVTKPIRKRP